MPTILGVNFRGALFGGSETLEKQGRKMWQKFAGIIRSEIGRQFPKSRKQKRGKFTPKNIIFAVFL